MGLTTAAIAGISVASGLVLGAGAGGGAVAYYNYRQEENKKRKLNEYYNALKDQRLQGRNVRTRMSSFY